MTLHDITESAKFRHARELAKLQEMETLRERLAYTFSVAVNILNDATLPDEEAIGRIGFFMTEMAETLTVGLQNEGPRPQE